MKKFILFVLSGILMCSGFTGFASEKGKWITVELEGKGEQIVEFEMDNEMYYALYFINKCEKDVIVERVSESGEVISTMSFAPGISGGTVPSEKTEKSKAGKYRFLIKSHKENELKGEFSYMISDDIKDFENTDIPSGYRVTSKTELAQLNDMGIMNEVGTGPYQNITRAEMAKIVAELININLPPQESGFSDVPEKHDYSGAVSVAKNMGIMCGYGNGIFRPDNDITYCEVVKTLVTLLGYEPKAEKEGYPVGYLKTANELGLTLSPVVTDSPLNKNEIAKLVFKATEIPLMVQQSFGKNAEYVITEETIKTRYLGK